jgi:DNA-directed RNA polymerase subunit M/transcription elongation factor TFIIS
MWRLKSCPKCHGDIYIDKDRKSWFEECLQCGFSRELAEMVVVEQHSGSQKSGSRAPRSKTPVA